MVYNSIKAARKKMSRKLHLKLCPYCDGQMDWDVIACPYCGSDVSEVDKEEVSNDSEIIRRLSPKETLASLYPPPYQPKVYDQLEEEQVFEEEIEEKVVEEKISFLPILLFSLGIHLLVFSLLLFFFSKNGELFLKFNGHMWIFYFIASVLMMYFGYRKFSKKEKVS